MELKEYLAPLRKWWWLMLVAASVAAFSSYLAVRQQQPIYQARTTLMIGRTIENPNPAGNEFFLSQELAATYADIARRKPVQDRAKEALGVNWLPEYTARRLPNTQLIEIIVTDTNPERAVIVANELARQLVLQSPTAAHPEEQERTTFIEEQLDELQATIRETQEEIAASQSELNDLVSARQIRDMQNQIAALETKLRTLQSNYAALLSSTQRGAINTLSIIDPASAFPVGPNRRMSVLTAALIGFVLAASAAYLLEYLDDTVKSAEQIERLTDLPVLAGIAPIEADSLPNKLVALHQPRSLIAEAFRSLRTGVQFATLDIPRRKLLITSANPSEGKSVTAANLAIVMAQAGYKVLLIDTDLRRPELHKLFGVQRNNGLTNLLLLLELEKEDRASAERQETLTGFIQKTAEPNLFVMASGPVPPNPSELLGSSKMGRLLDKLSSQFDYLILDSPPTLAVTDAILLSAQVDATLLVVDYGQTRRNQLQQSVKRLRDVKANLIGISLNRLKPQADGYFYYYQYQQTYGESVYDEAEEAELSTVVKQPKATNGFLTKLRLRDREM